MAFSSGTSNIANAIAPLVALDNVEMTPMILLGSAAVAVGAFTIARRTLDTLGNDITDLPLTAAIVVACVSSGIVISLSAVGIPASFVIIATMSIVGLGWGRATRTVTVKQGISGEKEPKVSVGAEGRRDGTDRRGRPVGHPLGVGSVQPGHERTRRADAERRPAPLDGRGARHVHAPVPVRLVSRKIETAYRPNRRCRS